MSNPIKWIVVGQSAYPSCNRCSAFPMIFWGKDEYGNYLLACRTCGILVARKTQLKELQKKAVKRFWGVKNDS
jgi:hypothetical protein